MRNTLLELQLAALAKTLRGCRLFSGLPVEDLNALAAITVVKRLDKGEYVFRQGDPSHGFYVVQRGAINIHRVSPAGKVMVIHIFRAGESFAEASVVSDQGYPADARAVAPSQVLLVRKENVLALVRRRPELALRMLAAMSLHLRDLIAQIEALTLKDVETRLAHWVLERCPSPQLEEPVGIELGTTKTVLAAELGTVSETLSRTFAKFRDQGLIQVQGNSLRVLSPSRLAALVEGGRPDGAVPKNIT